MEDKLDIFISYSYVNYESVHRIVEQLLLKGFKINEKSNLVNSDSNSNQIFTAIDNATVFLFFSSVDSNKSSQVEQEVIMAVNLEKSIVTINLDNSDYNSSFADSIEVSDKWSYVEGNSTKELETIIETKIKEDHKWVFISHSTKDFEIVRLVRNALEKKGHYPILFYLKCLSNKDEVNNLLKREIDARHRFILCNSQNARASEYVKEEVKYIRSKKRMFEEIDISKIKLDNPNVEQEILDLIKPYEQRVSVFLSYSSKSKIFVSQMKRHLERMGFNVWDHNFYADSISGTTTAQDWILLIKMSIKATLDKGYIISLLDENPPDFLIEGIKYAYNICPSRILPVILNKVKKTIFSGIDNLLDVSNENSYSNKAKVITETLIAIDIANNK